MSTFIIFSIILLIVFLIVRKMILDHKKGVSIQCGHRCSECNGGCNISSAIEDYKKDHPKCCH